MANNMNGDWESMPQAESRPMTLQEKRAARLAQRKTEGAVAQEGASRPVREAEEPSRRTVAAPRTRVPAGAEQLRRTTTPTTTPPARTRQGVGEVGQGADRPRQAVSQASRTDRATAPSSQRARRSDRQDARPTQAAVPVVPPASRVEPATSNISYSPVRHPHQHRGQRPKRSRLAQVLTVVLAIIFVGCLLVLGFLAYSYWQGRSEYTAVAEKTFKVEDVPAEVSELNSITIDWDTLKKTNPEVVGWIYIPGTSINYPVVQSTDNEKYLTTDFEGNTAWGASYGAIFLDYGNAGSFADDCNTLYGHNMQDGSMFADVQKYTDSTYFNEHREMFLLTPTGGYRLQAFALCHVPGTELFVKSFFTSEQEKAAYAQDKIDRSVVTPNPAVPAASELGGFLVLSTCDNLPSDGRYVLFASVVESKTSDAKVGAEAKASAQ